MRDHKTKYFHARASQQKRKNWIHSVLDYNERWVSSHPKIDKVFQNYFQSLFTSSDLSRQRLDTYLLPVNPIVTEEMNEVLISLDTKEEVKEALMQMVPLKSLSPDGFNATFFQSYWQIVDEEVNLVAFKFFNHGLFW